MKLRGYGDLLGFKQSGMKNFKLADPIHNEDLFVLGEKDNGTLVLMLGSIFWFILCFVILFFYKLWIGNLSFEIKDWMIIFGSIIHDNSSLGTPKSVELKKYFN